MYIKRKMVEKKSGCIYIKEHSTDIKNYKIKLYTRTGRYACDTLLNRIKANVILFLFKKKKDQKKSHPVSGFLYVFINKENSRETFIPNC